MAARHFARVPIALEVQFRRASSLLVAYSVNLSRGGLFLATDELLAPGREVALEVAVPGIGAVTVPAIVTWQREVADSEGPRGIGLEFEDQVGELGSFIDGLVADFVALRVLIVAAAGSDRQVVARMLRSIVASAEISFADDESEALVTISEEIDLLIVADGVAGERAASAVRRARNASPPIPVVALVASASQASLFQELGVDCVVGSPPRFENLRRAVVDALGRPSKVWRGVVA